MSIFKRLRKVPGTNGNLMINVHGEMWTKDGDYVPPEETDFEYVVTTQWMGGTAVIPVATLMCVTFKDIQLPQSLWYLIDPKAKDGNLFNVSLDNLYYAFVEPIEHEDYSGFFYIPYYTRYCISESGNCICAIDGKSKSWYITKPGRGNTSGGYRYTGIKNGNLTTTMGRHRALCLTFKNYDSDPDNLVTNHIDGIPGNDDLSNLEWNTYSENLKHAQVNNLRPNSTTPILMKNLHTGLIKEFNSIQDCQKHLNKPDNMLIWWRLNKTPDKVYPDGLMFKLDDGSEWPEVNTSNVTWDGRARPYNARNVFTGEIINFETLDEGSNFTGIEKGMISHHLANDLNYPIEGFNFRHIDKNLPWPEHSPYHLKIYKNHPRRTTLKGVFIYDVETNKETFYCCRNSAAKRLHVSKGRVAKLIQSKELFEKRYRLRYFETLKTIGLMES